jgi:hypothetical protein
MSSKNVFIYSKNITTGKPFLVQDVCDSKYEAETIILLDVLSHKCSNVRYKIEEEERHVSGR